MGPHILLMESSGVPGATSIEIKGALREYKMGTPQHAFYCAQHTKQTYASVGALLDKYSVSHTTMTMAHALSLLDGFVDPSDPDVLEDANSVHAYQVPPGPHYRHCRHYHKYYGSCASSYLTATTRLTPLTPNTMHAIFHIADGRAGTQTAPR